MHIYNVCVIGDKDEQIRFSGQKVKAMATPSTIKKAYASTARCRYLVFLK